MPVEGMPESHLDSGVPGSPFIIESRRNTVVEGMAEGVASLVIEKKLISLDVGPPYTGPEGCADSKSLQSSFSGRTQNGTIHDGRKSLEVGVPAADTSISEAGGVSRILECDPPDLEIVKGITHSESYKDNYSGKSPDGAPRSGEFNLSSSSEAGVAVDGKTGHALVKEGKSESGAKSFEGKPSGNGSSGTGDQRRALRTERGGMNGEVQEKLCVREPQRGKVFEGRSGAGYDLTSNTPDNVNPVGDASFDSSHAGGCLDDKSPEVHRNGENNHRTSDAGVSVDGRFSEKSFGSTCRHEERHHRHSRGSGTGIPNPALVERLYNPPHICNHVRCAANNPDYAMKQELPTKKYLVAKKHSPVGVVDKSRRISCDHDGGSTEILRRASSDHDEGSSENATRTSCDHDGVLSGRERTSSAYGGGSGEKSRRASCDPDNSHVLPALSITGANGNKCRRASGDSARSHGINNSAGKSTRTSVDSDRSHANSSSGGPHHRRGKSIPPAGFTPQGLWNSSVALDKKRGDHGFWSSVIVEKKHGSHGCWNSSVAVDNKQGDLYYGPWNGSVAIEKKTGERKDRPRSSLPGAAKHSPKSDSLHRSRRTSNEISIADDRRQKPRRSSIASDSAEAVEATNSRRLIVRAEDPSGIATASVSGLSEEGRSAPPPTTPRATGYEGSPSASVGSNNTDPSTSKDASWQRSPSSPESSCVTSGDSPSWESLSSVTRGTDSKAASRARYELPTMASRLPRFSSSSPQSLSASNGGKSPAPKPSWNSSTSKVALISAASQNVASVANTSTLAKNFLAKLKESTETTAPTAVVKAPTLPSWNSSITVAPNLFDYSTKGSAASRMARKTEAKQSSKTRKAVTGAEEQIKEHVDDKLKGDSPTPPVDTTVSPCKDTVAEEITVPIPENSAEKHIDPGSVVSIPLTPTSKLTRYASTRDSATNIPSPNKLSKVQCIKEKEKDSKVPAALNFGKRGRTTCAEETRKNETVNLKKGETAERRLSEEYMTDHTLATTVPRDIQGGRVKSLVHAFESLKTGPDAEHHHSADETVRCEYERELAAEVAASAPSSSPTT